MDQIHLIWLLIRPFFWTAILITLRGLPTIWICTQIAKIKWIQGIRITYLLILFIASWQNVETPNSLSNASFILLSQAIFGLGIAFVALAIIEILNMAGQLIDQISAFRASSNHAFSTFYPLAFFAIFFATDAHILLIHAFVSSYQIFAINGVLTQSFFENGINNSIHLSAAAISIAVAITIPIFAATLLLDFTFGWINRFMFTFQATFLAMPLRMLVTWLIILSSFSVTILWIIEEINAGFFFH